MNAPSLTNANHQERFFTPVAFGQAGLTLADALKGAEQSPLPLPWKQP
jgi:hypothetical protein